MTEPQSSGSGNFLTNPSNRKYWLIGGGTIGAVLVYKYFKSRSTATSTAGSTAATSTDSSLDPVTGVPYSEEEQYSGITTADGAVGQSFNAATGTYGVDPRALASELSDLGYSSNAGQGSTNPGVAYNNTAGKIVYDQATATYGQADASGGINWLNNTQAALVGATQDNATIIANANRDHGTNYTPAPVQNPATT